MTTTMHPLAEEYLSRLERAAQALPPPDRDELLTEIRNHLHAGLPGAPSDADVRNLLQELGRPEDIVAAAGVVPRDDPPDPGPPSLWGVVEIIAVLGLTVGTFVVPLVGPLVGIVLVWMSAQWTRREKVVATVLSILPVLILVLGGAVLFIGSSGSSVEVGPTVEVGPPAEVGPSSATPLTPSEGSLP